MDLHECMASKYRQTPDQLERSGLAYLESRGVTNPRDLLDQSVFDLAVVNEIDIRSILISLRAKSIATLSALHCSGTGSPPTPL